MKLQEIIKKDNFGFLISLGAVIVQAVHSQYVLTLVSSLGSWAWLHSSAVAFLISGAIMYFTLKKRKSQAIFWACFEVYMNLCYYSIFILTQDERPYHLFFIAIPSAIALPVILASFAEELIRNEQEQTEHELFEELQSIKNQLNLLEPELLIKIDNISNKQSITQNRLHSNTSKVIKKLKELEIEKLNKGTVKATVDGTIRNIKLENI